MGLDGAKAVVVLLLYAFRLQHKANADIRVGNAINVFNRYGYFSISMRVVPRNDTDHSWIFREPTVDVFTNLAGKQSLKRSIGGGQVFQGDFHMEFCDNVKQLMQAYFRDFSVERLDKPWLAFTGSWTKSTLARNLGLEMSYVTGDYCYVLVRVARHREIANLATDMDNSDLHEPVAKQAASVNVGDSVSVIEFVKSFGSHYVTSYITGNSLYQVYVYNANTYKVIKERLKSKGVSQISNQELTGYFSPWYAEHVGKIQSASGNETVENWALHRLRVKFYFFTYASLLKLHGDPKLLSELNGMLGNEALLKLGLKTLAPAFKDDQKRAWFHEVMDNNLKLWEVNM
ncbi:torso-like protein [Adelges cooleyi]|uniref:torso-like protein n=1 Tax=Adelges cooleyi TaxID=133065 RepID=UPI00217FD0B5|nr:torso-like protein [Adelges cooleyi]XP_050439979.1 torso-like protein [Adelges cooleyi]